MFIFKHKSLRLEGNWLLTGPNEIPVPDHDSYPIPSPGALYSDDEGNPINFRPHRKYGTNDGTQRETLGTVDTHTHTSSSVVSTRQRNSGSQRNTSQQFITAQGNYRILHEQNEDDEADLNV